MADFFNKDEEEITQEEETKEEPAKVKVGEKEYTQEELNELVSLGELGKEVETKYNTKLDRVWPEYTKTTQELKELKEKQKAEEEIRLNQKAQAGGELTDEEQVKQALAQAEKIGLVTKQSIRDYVVSTIREEREATNLLETCSDLEEEISGKDGRPVFKTEEVLRHMGETGIKNPEKAYKDLYETQIDRWKEEQIKKAKPAGLVTEEGSPSGDKQPPQVKADLSNLSSLVSEALEGRL